MSDLGSVERVRDRNAQRFWPKSFSCVLAVLGLLIGQSVVAQGSWITINGVGTLPVSFIESENPKLNFIVFSGGGGWKGIVIMIYIMILFFLFFSFSSFCCF